MTTGNQPLLNAIRVIVGEAVAPLAERVDRIATEQQLQRKLLEGIDGRLASVELRLTGIEERITALEEYAEKLDTRTSQIARDLFEMQDRLDQATRSLKRETTFSLKESSKLQIAQNADQKKIRELEAKVADLQRRLAALERAQGLQPQ